MIRHLGYVAIALSIDASTNRTCRLRNATPENLRSLIGQNLAGLREVLRSNLDSGIYLYRISSQVIPFASHPSVCFPWWEEFAEDLSDIGDLVRAQGMRVSMHPGQFTVLNSPDRGVVAASVAEIEWHVRFLDSLGTGPDSKIVIHLGGAYRNRSEAKERFVRAVEALPEGWRRRLVIENDERTFTIEDTLEVSTRTGLPVVFDWLHHRANAGAGDIAKLLHDVFGTWKAEDGPPKVHLSSQLEGGRLGQHDDWVAPEDARELLRVAPDREFDCMLEAKRKDLALFRLRAQLREAATTASPST